MKTDQMLSQRAMLSILLTLSVAILGLTSCQDPVTPSARNSLAGTIDGTSFSAVINTGVRNSSGVFQVGGNVNEDANLILSFRNEAVENHPVQIDGNLGVLLETLDSLAAVLPGLEDTVSLDSLVSGLEELLSTDDEFLDQDGSVLFYVIGNVVYYSESGLFRLTDIDPELQRISGTLDMTLVNFTGGRKSLIATMEDVQYLLDGE